MSSYAPDSSVKTGISDVARDHYENFPVASFLIPKSLRQDVAAVYWFARTADDLADEGDIIAEKRLINLENFEKRFIAALKGNYETKNDQILHAAVMKHNINPDYFTDLLSAFRQDVTKTRYADFDSVLDYCRRSANPVGRILLTIFNIREKKAAEYSDYICTALQLANFYQDVSIDLEKGRIYFAADEMRHFGVSEKMFEMKEINDNLKRLVKYNIERNEDLFFKGKNLLPFLAGRFRLEIKWTIEGGRSVLEKIRRNDYNVFIRPVLSKLDFITIFMKSIVK